MQQVPFADGRTDKYCAQCTTPCDRICYPAYERPLSVSALAKAPTAKTRIGRQIWNICQNAPPVLQILQAWGQCLYMYSDVRNARCTMLKIFTTSMRDVTDEGAMISIKTVGCDEKVLWSIKGSRADCMQATTPIRYQYCSKACI